MDGTSLDVGTSGPNGELRFVGEWTLVGDVDGGAIFE